ncbi:MAG: hypothetical protein HN509_12870 [Halobacteriovoraceae bacterium]|nr:hypothetical protein [Halobacteriovoraceae bacterium]MBT5094524.1 hypothetical protein [Halobacteriovoraceae bacterium]
MAGFLLILSLFIAPLGLSQEKVETIVNKLPERPWAVVEFVRGKVLFNGAKVLKGEKLRVDGSLEVSKRSFVKVKINGWDNTIVLGPRSAMELKLSAQKTGDISPAKYSLVKGACRWVRKKIEGQVEKGLGAVHTPNAAMGVRGTDFYLKVNPLLGETEIIVFDGEVEFTNELEVTDKKSLTSGQWGGVGGRYGQKIGEILNLSKAVLDKFGKKLNI